jgi:deoxyadenosine/deoxycytidine kinase
MSEREIRYIAIEGVIGVGKSTLARLLAQRLNAEPLLEEVEENPFLAEFYEDRARFAFQTQMHFLFSRYQQQRGLRQTDLFVQRVVSDYLFQKDRIFANLNLNERELVLYEKIVRELEVEVPRPDVVVYLQANTDTLLARIQQRGRTFERSMDREYLKALNEAYNYFFFHYSDAPLLVVNTDPIDFVRNAEELEDLSRRVQSHHEGTIYYTPMPKTEARPQFSAPKRRARRRQETTA